MKNTNLQNIFCFVKDLIFKLDRKVEKGERNDEMTRKSKSKAFSFTISMLKMYMEWLIFKCRTMRLNNTDVQNSEKIDQ